MTTQPNKTNPELDLVLERELDVPVELVWRAWTEPEQLKQWFCPRPWQVTDCEVDLRPGGVFRFTMSSPEGERHSHVCCYLEVVPQKRLVWSTAVLPGFRPAPVSQGVPDFTAVLELTPRGQATRYVATAMHRDPSGRDQHEQMGFHEGWGTCVDQLVELLKR